MVRHGSWPPRHPNQSERTRTSAGSGSGRPHTHNYFQNPDLTGPCDSQRVRTVKTKGLGVPTPLEVLNENLRCFGSGCSPTVVVGAAGAVGGGCGPYSRRHGCSRQRAAPLGPWGCALSVSLAARTLGPVAGASRGGVRAASKSYLLPRRVAWEKG